MGHGPKSTGSHTAPPESSCLISALLNFPPPGSACVKPVKPPEHRSGGRTPVDEALSKDHRAVMDVINAANPVDDADDENAEGEEEEEEGEDAAEELAEGGGSDDRPAEANGAGGGQGGAHK